MLSCSVWFSAPSFRMGGGLESRCVGCAYGADGAVHHPHRIYIYILYFSTVAQCKTCSAEPTNSKILHSSSSNPHNEIRQRNKRVEMRKIYVCTSSAYRLHALVWTEVFLILSPSFVYP